MKRPDYSVQGELVVCTKDRPAEVARLFRSYARLDARPTVLVVDASARDDTKKLIGLAAERWGTDKVRYLHTAPGLATQRMRGIREARPDACYIHFVDDDVVLQPDYFLEIERAFATDARILGVGGRIDGLRRNSVSWGRRIFRLDSLRQGTVLPSGVNVLVFDVPGVADVGWLSGCAMSYRREVFETLEFDTRLIGYSLGEDLDFSYRVGLCGRLVNSEGARLQHLESPVDRLPHDEWLRQAWIQRHRWVCEMSGCGGSRTWFWWALLGECVLSFLAATRGHISPLRRLWRLLAIAATIVRQGPVSRNPRLEKQGLP